jgi:hypothetical protein
MFFKKFLSDVISKLEKLSMPTKLAFIAAVSLIAVWLVCKQMTAKAVAAAAAAAAMDKPLTNGTAYLPGMGFQDPGYGSGVGSIGAMTGMDEFGKQYPSMPFYQVSCAPEPQWNLPLDARLRHQPVFPVRSADEVNASASCHRHHPMDTIYAPPNEGIMLN